jgi:hypothetical protein
MNHLNSEVPELVDWIESRKNNRFGFVVVGLGRYKVLRDGSGFQEVFLDRTYEFLSSRVRRYLHIQKIAKATKL